MTNLTRLVRRLAILPLICLVVACSTPGGTESTKPGATTQDATAAGVGMGDMVTLSAEVIAIDKADRALELLSDNGEVVELDVGDEVRNFDQIAVGDVILAKYFESIAIYIGAPGSLPQVQVEADGASAVNGEKPGGVLAESVDISASITAIDRSTREVTLKLPDGSVRHRKVDSSVKAFDTLKVGDSVHARLTHALAIEIVTP